MVALRFPSRFSTIVENRSREPPRNALLPMFNAHNGLTRFAALTMRLLDGYGLMPDDIGAIVIDAQSQSVESRASWIAAGVTLAILSVAYGSTLIIVVGLRAMELDLGVSRSTL